MPEPTRLYRVFPWVEGAAPSAPGHPLYVPRPQGRGRIDNPEHYLVLYASDDPVGAIGEAFGNHATWTRSLLDGPPALPGSRRALAVYAPGGAPVLDLDDPHALAARDIRPSRVVTRDRARTQSWALGVFGEQRWSGVRWWSYYDPDWGSFGLWDIGELAVQEVIALEDAVGLVERAAAHLVRTWRG